MRNFGILVAVCGLLAAGYFGLIYNTKEEIGGSIGGASIELSVTDNERVQTRRTGLFIGLGALVCGGVMVALSSRKS